MDFKHPKNRKIILPTLSIDDSDIPNAVELKATMQTKGWQVFEKLYKQIHEETLRNQQAAILMEKQDRDITLKGAVLLGIDACFGLAEDFVFDVEEMVKKNKEEDNAAQND